MTPISEHSKLSSPDHVLMRKARGETVLLNLDNEQYYGLRGVGTRLWDLVEAGTRFSEAIDSLLEEFDVDRATLTTDLAELLDDLQQNGLVHISAG